MTTSVPTLQTLSPQQAPRPAAGSAEALPLVCAAVPAFNRCDRTLNFLHQFAKVQYPNKRVVICDDGSTDNTYHNVRLNFPDADVLRGDGHLWWSGGTNMAVRHALAQGADYILTINDDVHMEPDFLTEMVKVARQNPKYIVGCRLHRQDKPGRLWSLGTSLVFNGYEIFRLNNHDRDWSEIEPGLPDPLPVDTMPGNGVLIPRSVFEKVGFYDERHMPQYHADSDLVLRAKAAGYRPVIALRAVLYNHILEKPLVATRWSLVFSRKSDRYWKPLWATLRRHGPFGKRLYLLWLQYWPFFYPTWIARLSRAVRRALHLPQKGEPAPAKQIKPTRDAGRETEDRGRRGMEGAAPTAPAAPATNRS